MEKSEIDFCTEISPMGSKCDLKEGHELPHICFHNPLAINSWEHWPVPKEECNG